MPVYEYACRGCGGRTELLLAHARAGEPGPCPDCGGTLARRFSRIGVKLEGWGFAATDAMVPDRPGRGDFARVRDRAERLSRGEH